MTENSNSDESPKTLKETDREKITEPGDGKPEQSVFNNDIIELTESLDESFDIEIVELTEEIPGSAGTLRDQYGKTSGDASFEADDELTQEFHRPAAEKPVELTDVIQNVSEPHEPVQADDGSTSHMPQEKFSIAQKLAAGIQTYYGIRDIPALHSPSYSIDPAKALSKVVKDLHHPGAEAASVEETYEFERKLKESPDVEMAFETSLGMELDEEIEEESSILETQPLEGAQSLLVEIPGSVLSEGLLETLVPGSSFTGDEKLYVQLPIQSDVSSDSTSLADDQAAAGVSASTRIVSGQAVETALENVIKKLYAEKIEHALEEAIERIVKEDIEKLKGILFDGIQSDH